MAVLHSILVPVDGSPPSLAALDHAIALARDYDGTIDVLHVQPEESIVSAPPDPDGEQAIAEAVERAREALSEDRVTMHTRVGDPVREIVLASRSGIDLIVIGTHGRMGRLHSLLGSVAEGVVRNAMCPVMTVRDPSGGYQSFAEHRHGRPAVSEIQPR